MIYAGDYNEIPGKEGGFRSLMERSGFRDVVDMVTRGHRQLDGVYWKSSGPILSAFPATAGVHNSLSSNIDTEGQPITGMDDSTDHSCIECKFRLDSASSLVIPPEVTKLPSVQLDKITGTHVQEMWQRFILRYRARDQESDPDKSLSFLRRCLGYAFDKLPKSRKGHRNREPVLDDASSTIFDERRGDIWSFLRRVRNCTGTHVPRFPRYLLVNNKVLTSPGDIAQALLDYLFPYSTKCHDRPREVTTPTPLEDLECRLVNSDIYHPSGSRHTAKRRWNFQSELVSIMLRLDFVIDAFRSTLNIFLCHKVYPLLLKYVAQNPTFKRSPCHLPPSWRGTVAPFSDSNAFTTTILRLCEPHLLGLIGKQHLGGIPLRGMVLLHALIVAYLLRGEEARNSRPEMNNLTCSFPRWIRIVILLDIRGAFDSYILKRSDLQKTSLKEDMIDLLLSWVNDWHYEIGSGSDARSVTVNVGSPQGSDMTGWLYLASNGSSFFEEVDDKKGDPSCKDRTHRNKSTTFAFIDDLSCLLQVFVPEGVSWVQCVNTEAQRVILTICGSLWHRNLRIALKKTSVLVFLPNGERIVVDIPIFNHTGPPELERVQLGETATVLGFRIHMRDVATNVFKTAASMMHQMHLVVRQVSWSRVSSVIESITLFASLHESALRNWSLTIMVAAAYSGMEITPGTTAPPSRQKDAFDRMFDEVFQGFLLCMGFTDNIQCPTTPEVLYQICGGKQPREMVATHGVVSLIKLMLLYFRGESDVIPPIEDQSFDHFQEIPNLDDLRPLRPLLVNTLKRCTGWVHTPLRIPSFVWGTARAPTRARFFGPPELCGMAQVDQTSKKRSVDEENWRRLQAATQADKLVAQFVNESTKGTLLLATDASCENLFETKPSHEKAPSAGAWKGWVVRASFDKISSDNTCLNGGWASPRWSAPYFAECHSLVKMLRALLNDKQVMEEMLTHGYPIVIVIDAWGMAEQMIHFSHHYRIPMDLSEVLYCLRYIESLGIQITFIWCPSHTSDTPYGERSPTARYPIGIHGSWETLEQEYDYYDNPGGEMFPPRDERYQHVTSVDHLEHLLEVLTGGHVTTPTEAQIEEYKRTLYDSEGLATTANRLVDSLAGTARYGGTEITQEVFPIDQRELRILHMRTPKPMPHRMLYDIASVVKKRRHEIKTNVLSRALAVLLERDFYKKLLTEDIEDFECIASAAVAAKIVKQSSRQRIDPGLGEGSKVSRMMRLHFGLISREQYGEEVRQAIGRVEGERRGGETRGTPDDTRE